MSPLWQYFSLLLHKEPSISVSRKVTAPFGSFRCGCSCALTKPMGTIPCFLVALSSRVRALSRASSSSKA
jgi:hypothetical protein